MKQLERVLKEVEQAPGIVLYTIVKKELIEEIERRCRELKVPSLHVLQPIMKVFESYLGAPQTPVVAGQHMVDADYFRRIDALNFTMAHDDGQLPQDLNTADIIILGISRTSKTPTSIYLAQRGYKTCQPAAGARHRAAGGADQAAPAFVVGLVASPERIAEIRRNRVHLLADRNLDDYVDRTQIANELAYSRRLCARHGWPVIDVTRRSIEETAATIIRLLHDRDEAAPARSQRETDDELSRAAASWSWPRRAPFRRRMLEAAGLSFRVVPADVDEAALKRSSSPSRSPRRRGRRGPGAGQGRGGQRAHAGRPRDRRRPGAGARRRAVRQAGRPRRGARAAAAAARQDAPAAYRRRAGAGGARSCGAHARSRR